MDLRQINNPQFLKDLDYVSIRSLCNEIREFIISYCAENGGYLSGNLSSVEISVILNKEFNESDCLLFDGNDINYTNKILNGKIDELQVNSNGAYSLGNALGLAVSRDLNHKNNYVVCVINSTDLASGRYIEALNLASQLKRKLIIVFNDDTPIDKGIGIVNKVVSSLRNTYSYNNLKENVKDMIRPASHGEEIIENIHNVKSSIRKNIIDEGVFGDFDIDYIGPIDGHNLKDLSKAFNIAKEKDYPVVVHCITTGGKGYKYAEACTNGAYYKVGKFNIENGEFYLKENESFRFMKNIVGLTLERLMGDDDRLLCITTRNFNDYGVANVFAKYPSRSFETLSSGDNTLSFAAGLCLDDKIPFVPLKDFELLSSYRVLKNQVCKLNKPLLIGLIDNGNINYNLLYSLSNINILKPEDSLELQNIIYNSIDFDKPSIIVYPEKCIEYTKIDDFSEFNVGKWPKNGNNDNRGTLLISSGTNMKEISNIVLRNELDINLIEMNSYLPLDEELLVSLSDYNKVYVYDDAAEMILVRYLYEKNLNVDIEFIEEKGIDYLFEKIK